MLYGRVFQILESNWKPIRIAKKKIVVYEISLGSEPLNYSYLFASSTFISKNH